VDYSDRFTDVVPKYLITCDKAAGDSCIRTLLIRKSDIYHSNISTLEKYQNFHTQTEEPIEGV
jgi:hypothetical protein